MHDADFVIRMRADNFVHSFSGFPLMSGITAYTSGISTPWWGKFGGLNDRFAVMEPEMAADYFGVYYRIPKLLEAGCPFHPESLLKAATEQHYHLDAQILFSTARPPSHPQHPQRWPEICPWERAP